MNRRDFVKVTAGMGAALGLAGTSLSAPTGMYISMNGTVARVPWPEFARLAAKVGYGGADVNLNGAIKEGPDATKALLAELKLRPAYCGFPVPATRDEDAYKKALEGLDEQVKFAAAIGCNRMIHTSWGAVPATSTKEEYRKMLVGRFQTAGEVLAKYNVRCGFEFLGPLQFRSRLPSFATQMNEMLDFAKDCGPNYGLLLDAWHWYHAGATIEDIHKAGKARIVTVHVSDAAKMPPEEVRDNARLMPGEGVIDLVGFFKALKEIGYEDGVSPEPLGRIPKEMPAEESAKLGYDTTRAVLRKAGIDV
jgi:sugar phosphate isomerase/epimerase